MCMGSSAKTCADDGFSHQSHVCMQGLGQASALNNPLLNITMFAPVNSAFTAPLPPVSIDTSMCVYQTCMPLCSLFRGLLVLMFA